MHSSSKYDALDALDDKRNYSHTLQTDHSCNHTHDLNVKSGHGLEYIDQGEDRSSIKRLKNRIASRKCRERKELKILFLQARLQQLIVENQVLKEMLKK